jgi:hypothetical protein
MNKIRCAVRSHFLKYVGTERFPRRFAIWIASLSGNIASDAPKKAIPENGASDPMQR